MQKAQQVEGILTDMAGRQIASHRHLLAAGSSQWRADVSRLAAGVYHLTLRTGDGLTETLRWVKQ
jgi:hypothetical protein